MRTPDFRFLSGENQRNAPVFTMFEDNKKAAARYFGRSDLNNEDNTVLKQFYILRFILYTENGFIVYTNQFSLWYA